MRAAFLADWCQPF